jgi:hypothetical protein
MSVEKLSVSMPPEVAAQVRAAALAANQPVSAWVAEALGERLRQEALGELVAGWQAEGGVFTPEELDDARRRLGFDPSVPPAEVDAPATRRRSA